MFGTGETHVLAQNFQQSFVDLRGDLLDFAVDAKLQLGFGELPSAPFFSDFSHACSD